MTIGHNQIDEAERRILFAYYHRKDRQIAAEIRSLNEKKKSNRQNAKASGFSSAKLDHYLKAFLAEDKQAPVDKLKSDRENLAWLGLIPDDPKGDLLADRATDEQMVDAKGFHAGLTAMDRVSGYDAGSVDDRTWLEAYDRGREEYDTKLPDIWKRIEQMNSSEATPQPATDSDDPYADVDTEES
ncbi:hypothetical protein [Pseudohoeflea coraliihabitans]|uniref:Terminase small subunit n=1 Tax=Pseudohoeflea coraliihabitans TaxID=2860393 RepID=A0ABS6WLR2_9HYPH|nr:hypothetical protein [Pseudohoeflea sp. DP4N28-3]MBW3096835.1 hypothetical protein [Pseudohoeflea sp. DP4N28-3]